MTDKTCKNCKFWERNSFVNTDFGKCKKDVFLQIGWDVCADIFPVDSVAIYSNEEACADSGEDFGCIHFDEK